MKRNANRLNLEQCEQRDMMSATVNLSKQVLTVTGDHHHDTISIRQTNTHVVVNQQLAYKNSEVSRIVVKGNGGNDTINLEGVTVRASIYGGSGNDVITGSNAADYINGEGNNDTIFGRSGNDTLVGSSGNDRLFGDSGYDYLYGEAGTDFLDDGNRSGSEYLNSGTGADFFADTWVVNGCSVRDIDQRSLPTCSFLASLAAGADAGINYGSWITYDGYTSSGMPVYSVSLWHPKSGFFSQQIGFDGTVNQYDTGLAANNSQIAEFESWVLLMQRAYLNYVGGDGASSPSLALPTATGGNVVHYNTGDSNAKADLVRALNADRPIVCSIINNTLYGIKNHAMTVVSARGTFDNLEVRIYNPWGKDGVARNGQGVAVDGVNDGYFWISWNVFKSYMDGGFWIR